MSQNNYPNANPQNQPQIKANGNIKSMKKYGDFEIQTFFSNEKNTGMSAKDMQLKNELNTITNQYMATFNTINELSRKFSQGNENMCKVDMVRQDINQIDFQGSNDYSKFISQLYDITKNANVANLTYDNYKNNKKGTEQEIKKVINDFKYDIILFTNKNSSQDVYKRLNNFVSEQKSKEGRNNYYNNYNNNDKNKNNNDYNQNLNPAPSQNNYNYQNYNDNNNRNGNSYYNNYNNGGSYGSNYNYNQGNGNDYYL